MTDILTLRDVHKEYIHPAGNVQVLCGASLAIKAGECVGLIGPSGSGKSTLLHIAGLLDVPTSGEVLIEGLPMQCASDGDRTLVRRQRLGFIYQFHYLLAELTSLENVSVPLRLQGENYKERAMAMLESLGMQTRAKHFPHELSGGEQQRVAIARALVHRPKLLLADEPTGNLDPENSARALQVMLPIIREHGGAALIATHNVALAKQLDYCITINNGAIVPVAP
jgi:lipoprotein-releasing system ATP-binding protein